MTGKKLLGSFAALWICTASIAHSAESDEEVVGRAAAAQILGAAPLVANSGLQQYVGSIGSVLKQGLSSKYSWKFGVVKSDAINAFAAPAGYVLISEGLFRILDSEDELAFVIAHEMIHVDRRHYYQVIVRQRLAAQAMKNLQEVNQGSDLMALSAASGQLYARGLDKSAEYEADRLGVELLTRSGYDPAAAIGVLEKIQRFKGNDPKAELLFATHPSATDRLETLLMSGIEQLPRPSANSISQRLNRFKMILGSL